MGFWFGGPIMMLLILIILVAAVFLAVRLIRPGRTHGESAETPLDIIRKRYARGEITKEQYDRLKSDLAG